MPAAGPDLTPLALHAAGLVSDGMVVGLGSGSASTAFIHALGEKVRAGLRITGVPTSNDSNTLASSLGIPTDWLDDIPAIDVAVDGADEVDPSLNLIKGYGGALVREKVVAASSKKFVVLIGPGKTVPALGTRGRLPVEVLPFALGPVSRALAAMGIPGTVRQKDGTAFVTDNGNHILDCAVGPTPDAAGLEARILALVGVVDTGFFLGMNPTVLSYDGTAVTTLNG
jgi:ribose 5-phosphate isomerase A